MAEPRSDLDRIVAPSVTPSDEGEAKEAVEGEAADLEKQREKAEALAIAADTRLREKYAPLVTRIAIWWLVIIVFFLLLQGFGVPLFGKPFDLSDGVLIALVTGATVNVLGIFLVVVQYLFPRKG